MTTLLLPVTGPSCWTQWGRPSWSLTHPGGRSMIVEVVRALDIDTIERICIVGSVEDDHRFQLVQAVEGQLGELGLAERTEFVLLAEPPHDTTTALAHAVERAGVEGPVYVKTADTRIRHTPGPGNVVAVHVTGPEHGSSTARRGDRIVELEDDDVIAVGGPGTPGRIVLAGGYAFADVAELLSRHRRARAATGGGMELHELVGRMVADGARFTASPVTAYEDWSTEAAWRSFERQHATLFVDLDGVLVRHSGGHTDPRWGTTDAIEPNVRILNELHEAGRAHIVVTTSRAEHSRALTEEQLVRIGLRYDSILLGLPHARRIVVNDRSATQPDRSCDAIELRRDSADLLDELRSLLGPAPTPHGSTTTRDAADDAPSGRA